MTKIIFLSLLMTVVILDGCSVHSLRHRLRMRAQSIAAEDDTAASQRERFFNVCFPASEQSEIQDDSCFSISRNTQWYYSHPYPPHYAVFHYRQFGTCPPYTYYTPDCDCCKRAGQQNNSSVSSQKTEEEPIHSSIITDSGMARTGNGSGKN